MKVEPIPLSEALLLARDHKLCILKFKVSIPKNNWEIVCFVLTGHLRQSVSEMFPDLRWVRQHL